MRRFFCLFLCLVLVVLPLLSVSFAAEPATLSDRVQKFIFENNLNSQNFSLSYYNCDSKESFTYNVDALFPAGNLWKLPLHMYYYEQEAKGAFEPSAENHYKTFELDGSNLEDCRYRSIILGEESISIKMREELGSHDVFKQMVNEDYGHIPAEKLTESYYYENVFSARFWMNCLLEINQRKEYFQDMMLNYNMVQTADGIAGYEKTYPMVHIRGEEDGFICDIGEVRGPQTYLLVCSVNKPVGGEEILGKISTLICEYVEETTSQSTPSGGNNFQRGEESMQIVSGENQDRETAMKWVVMSLGAALALAVVIGVVVWVIRRSQREEYDF